jgi:hypothetical protein
LLFRSPERCLIDLRGQIRALGSKALKFHIAMDLLSTGSHDKDDSSSSFTKQAVNCMGRLEMRAQSGSELLKLEYP